MELEITRIRKEMADLRARLASLERRKVLLEDQEYRKYVRARDEALREGLLRNELKRVDKLSNFS